MADITITQLPLKTGTASSTDEIEIDDGASKKTTLAQLPVSTAAQAALDGKAATSHTHTLVDVTDYFYDLATTAFTAVIGGHYALNTTAASFNVTLPASPTEGQSVCFIDAKGTWNTNPPTFLRNGNKIEAQEVNFTNAAQGTFFCMVFIDSTTGWRILESGTKPQNLIAPVITGNEVGVAITSTNGTWTGSPTSYTYKWQVSDDGSTGWADISGATSATYTPVSGDEDKYVRLQVTATNSNGSSLPAYSAASDQIEVPAFPSGAVAFWKLADLTDASGNSRTLTNNNSVTFVAGKIGNAGSYNGSDQYLSLAENLLKNRSALSISVWVKTTTTDGYIIGCDLADELNALVVNSGGIANFNCESVYSPVGSTTYVNDDAWHHVVVTFDAGTVKVYVDGVLETTDATKPSTTLNAGPSVTNIGVNGGGDYAYWPGLIDALGIWHRALSDAEIATLYNSGTGLEPA
jgi:hypothetical protein